MVSVKVNTADISQVIEEISSVWDRFSPNEAFRYTFLDESFARMYADVQRMGLIFTSFAMLAIIIACLGLFALSAFMVEQRSKEISIRIVLGASGKTIFGLLTFSVGYVLVYRAEEHLASGLVALVRLVRLPPGPFERLEGTDFHVEADRESPLPGRRQGSRSSARRPGSAPGSPRASRRSSPASRRSPAPSRASRPDAAKRR